MSKLPLSAVAEWAVGPWLVQLTVSPAWIVIEAGPKEKSLIVTALDAAALAVRVVVPFVCVVASTPESEGAAAGAWVAAPSGGA